MNAWQRIPESARIRNIVLGLALALHILVCFRSLQEGRWITDDTISYFRLSENLLRHGCWSQAWEAPYVPDHQRTPGYPFLILLCFQSPFLLIPLQHLLVLGTGWIIWKHLRRRISERHAQWAGILYVLNPYAIGLASFGLTETSGIFFMALAWQQVSRNDQWRSVFFATLALAIAAYIRPNALALAGIWMVWGLVALIRRQSGSTYRIALAGVAVVLLMMPWMIRVSSITGRVSLSTVADIAAVNGRMGGMFVPRVFPQETDLYHASDSVLLSRGIFPWKTYPGEIYLHENQVYTDDALDAASQVLVADPVKTMGMMFRSALQMFSGTGAGWISAATGWQALGHVLGAIQVLLSAGLLIRFLLRFRAVGWQECWPVLLAAMSLWLPALSLLADGRYRFFAEWLFWML